MADEVDPADLEIVDELIAEICKEKPGETPADMTLAAPNYWIN